MPAGSPSIDFIVIGGVHRVVLDEAILPVDAHVHDESGEYTGELLLWLEDGLLSSLEYAWVTDSMPDSLPEVERLRVSLRC
jgi:hypothetical protein